MWRALVFVALLFVAAFAAVWLANHPETVAVTWQGREYSTSLALSAVAILVLAMLIALLWAGIRFLLNLPERVGRGSRKRKQARGLSAVSRGIVAVGAGDVAAARRHSREAERLIGHEPLALLLKAQTAQASGNREAAEATFRRMTEHADTRVLGLRGLFVEAKRRGDTTAARDHAEEAARAAPAVGWANEAVLEGYSADGDWTSAIRMIERRTSLGLIDRATSRRQRAVLHTADGLAKDEAGNPEGAATAALEAVRLAPDLVPAAALAGRQLSRRGDLRQAARVIETAWKAHPHPDLAAAYLNLRSGDSALDRLKRAENLARLSSWSPESRLAMGRAAIEARELPRAREVMQPLLDGSPSMRVCLMMAELEQADGSAGRVREWLARATRAPRDEVWIADGVVSDHWMPLSPVTGRLDAFRWETPPLAIGDAEVREGLLAGPADELQPAAPRLPKPASVEVTSTSATSSEQAGAPELTTASSKPAMSAKPALDPIGHVAVGSSPREMPDRPAAPVTREPQPVKFPAPKLPDDPGPVRREERRVGSMSHS